MNGKWRRYFALAMVWAMLVPMFAYGEEIDIPEAFVETPQEIIAEAAVEAPVEELAGLTLGDAEATEDEAPAVEAEDAEAPEASDDAEAQAEPEAVVDGEAAEEEAALAGETAPADVKVKSIKLSDTKVYLIAGEPAYKLEATVTPANATNRDVEWVSTKPKVAKVNDKGEVTGLTTGKTTIIARAADGGAVRGTCEVQVTKGNSQIGRIEVEPEIVVAVKGTYTVKPTLLPKNPKNKELKWSSKNKKIAKVSSKGVVTGVKAGTTTVTIEAAKGGVTAKFKVTVVKDDKKVHKILLNKETLKLDIGKKETLTATAMPTTAKKKTVTWKSENKKVATVTSKGVVKGVKAGTTTITATAKDGSGVVAACEVTVEDNTWVKSVKLDAEKLTLTIGDSKKLTATITPSTALDKSIEWKSSDPDIVSVSKGTVTAVGEGTATITATSKDGSNQSASCEVTSVNTKPVVTAVTLDKRVLSVEMGKDSLTETLKATISPSGVDSKLTWTSSDKSVAAVDKSGKVTINGLGSAEITVQTENGKTAVCKVTVVKEKPVVEWVTLSEEKRTVRLGIDAMTFSLKATVSPIGADDKITWKSSDETTATVDKDGKVTIIGVGKTTVTAYALSGNANAECEITVVNPDPTAARLTLNKSKLTVNPGAADVQLVATVSPKDAKTTVTWSSSDTKVATVDAQSGLVKFVAQTGKAVITAKTDNNLTATCDVEIVPAVVTATDIKLNRTSIDTTFGTYPSVYKLTATVTPANAQTKVTWSSTNDTIARVNETTGEVAILGAGSCEITAKTDNGKSDKCIVNVAASSTEEKLSLNKTDIPVTLGSSQMTYVLNATLDDGGVGVKRAVEWTTNNPDVAQVKAYDDDNTTAKVTLTGAIGEAFISARTPNGLEANCAIKVAKPQVQSVTLDKSRLELTLGTDNTSYALKATVSPAAADDTIVWTSEDENVVRVSADGLVEAVGVGTKPVKITATGDNGKAATCEVTVNNSVAGVTRITLDKTSKRVELGTEDTISLNATVSPVNSNNKLTWASSNEKVAKPKTTTTTGASAKVDVEIVGLGSADITVKAPNGKTATFALEVINPLPEAKQIVLSRKSIKVQYSKDTLEYDLTATLTPAGAEGTIAWSSGDKDVAKVDKEGHVTIVGLGETQITAKVLNKDGAVNEDVKPQTCSVVVTNALPAVTKVTLNKSSIKVTLGKDAMTYTLKATVSPTGASPKVTWKSSNTKVAKVDKNTGVVTIVGKGKATITATASNKKKKSCKITVVDK